MRTIVLKDGRVHRGSRKTSSTRASIMAEDIQTAHALSLKSVLTPAPTHFPPLRLLRWHNVSRILQTLWQNCDRSAMAEWLMEMFEWLLNQVLDGLWCHCPVGHKANAIEETSLGAHPKLYHLLEVGEGGGWVNFKIRVLVPSDIGSWQLNCIFNPS